MSIDLSPWQQPSKLIDAIWEVRRGERRDLFDGVAALLDHEDAIVREEAMGLLFVKWGDTSLRERLMELIRSDPDFGVRSQAALALAATSRPQSKSDDVQLLRSIVLNRSEDPNVRVTAYEALYQMVNGKFISLDDDTDIDEDVDLDWLRMA
jgi:HEAT repeat protein